ncbi:MAG: S8 family serine peptidase [Crocinitomicaceae bacterium]|nr:S8 family serine peptidase [Crocinitomicaceae bacterium]
MNQLVKLVAVSLLAFSSFGQTQQTIFFNSGEYKMSPVFDQDQTYSPQEVVDGYYFRLVQFANIPSQITQEMLASQGVELIEYLPRNAFFVKISAGSDITILQNSGVISMEKIQDEFKLSRNLSNQNYPHWTLFGTDKIELNTKVFKGISSASAMNMLTSVEGEFVQMSSPKLMTIRIDISKLDELYSLPCFSYFETIPAPGEPENLVGRTNHRSNSIASDYEGGLKYDGTGVTIMMQDDGYIGPHIDYKGRNDQSNCSGCSSNDADDHGDHVAGTIMGAGNIDPSTRGMAFGADLLVYGPGNWNYNSVPNLYANNDMVITSKSYSSGCNGGYDGLTSQLDEQVRTMPSLIHVFSAGNSGTSDCGYGAGSNWGNITGGHKSGKNVIAVGNLLSNDALAGSSSRGPATDGRIKPDVCGVGTSVNSTIPNYTYGTKTGTSMSCPGVAGSIGQLYHAYKDMNGGMNPVSGLIKATVLNTAEDLGNPGPDFKHGWGRINVRRAYELLSQNNYQSGTISQGGNNNHTIDVPVGTTELKLMLYWTDYEGSTNASIALVNDLNMVLTDPGMVSYNPWVLNSSPNAGTLDDDAIQAVDNLNNMEQVTIDNPLPGTYTINIDGFAVPQGPQDYFLVYEYGRDEVSLTYPNGGEGLNPGTGQTIRWDATGNTTDFTVEYTTDNGASWNLINTVAANLRQINWPVPNTISGLAKVRVTRGGSSDESNEVFSILGTPTNLAFGWACPDSLNITWNNVSGATGYEVSMLGAKFMDSIGTTSLTNLTVAASAADENWFSVRALGPDDARGERAIAIRKTPGEFGCTWSAPYASMNVLCESISNTTCAQVFDQSINTDAGSSYLWYFPNGTPTTSTDQNPTVCYTTTGMQDAALVVTNSAGSDSVYFNDYLNVISSRTLPYFEGFETISNFNTTDDWSTENYNNNSTFQVSSLAALGGSKSARLANHNQASGSVDELISGPIDLTSIPSNGQVTLSFRYSYKKRTTDNDEWLRISVANDCENNWTLRKTMHGTVLSAETQNTPWVPSDSSDWTTVHVTNITNTFFTGEFKFKFNFENDGGNNFYLDNINLYEGSPSDNIIAAGIEDLNSFEQFSLYPNPTASELNVSFNIQESNDIHVSIQDLQGKLIQTHKIHAITGSNIIMMNTEELSPGLYFLNLQSNQSLKTAQFIVK